MNLIRIVVFIAFLFFFIKQVSAQGNEKSKAADEAVKTCIGENKNAPEALGADFSIFTWASTLQKNCAEVLDNKNSEVLFEIADQKPVIDALLTIAGTCKTVGEVEKHLQKMKKIYDKKVKARSNSTVDNKGFQEERVVSLTINDARLLKIQVNSVVNMLKGNNTPLKVFR